MDDMSTGPQLTLWPSAGASVPASEPAPPDTDRSDAKALRIACNRRALQLITQPVFDRAEVFRLYTGTGGLIVAGPGESFLAASHKALGQYFTPSPLAKLIVDLLTIPPGARVLDNTCGHGSLLWHLPERCYATGIEVQEDAHRIAKALSPHQTIVHGDCLDYTFTDAFHYALINPPFGLHWRTDLALDLAGHGGRILSHVACLELAVRAVVPSGYVAAILPLGALKRPDLVTFRRWYRTQARVIAEVSLPAETFDAQGAHVATTLVILRKLPASRHDGFRYVVRSAEMYDDTAPGGAGDFASVRHGWCQAPVAEDARQFAASITDAGPVAVAPRQTVTVAPVTDNRRATPVPQSEQLVLKKGRYALSFQSGDVLTALKLAEIRALETRNASTDEDDAYATLVSLQTLYVSDETPRLLSLLQAYGIDWRYDRQLANWIARKRRWWRRQQFVYQTYHDAAPAEEPTSPDDGTAANVATLVDHFPQGYLALRRALDRLGVAPLLYEYQQIDAARLATKPCNALLYDMGLGKTRTSIATALLAGSQRVLIVCLSRLVKVWTDELAKLGITDVTVIRSPRDLVRLARFNVVAYEKLSRQETRALDTVTCPSCAGVVRTERCPCGWRRTRSLVCPKCRSEHWTGHACTQCGYVDRVWVPPLVKRLRRLRWGMVIVDESQMMKTKDSLRSLAVASLSARRKLLLTGTLIKGYVPDIFWQLHWCFGGGSPGFPYPWRGGAKQFIRQFATYAYASDEYQDRIQGKKKMVPKVRNLPQFWQLLGPKVIRRLVTDPLVAQSIRLPEKSVRVVMVDLAPAQQAVYDWWYEHFVEWYTAQLEREERDANYTMKNAAILGQLWKLRQAATCPHVFTGAFGGPAYAGGETNKHRALYDLVGALPHEDKAVVFTGYNPNALLMAEQLSTVHLIGSTAIDERNQVIEQFQTAAHPRVLVVGLLAMNLGQTLTRANHAYMTDLDWCPSSMVQAEGRLLRISQERPVQVTYLLSRGTIDEDMYELLYQKQAAINEAIDHQAHTERVAPLSIRDFVHEMVKRKGVKP